MRPAAYAIPGDITTQTGGYVYERRMLYGLRDLGRDVRHVQLQAGFPEPTEAAMQDAIDQLAALPADRPVILDGLVFGSITPAGLRRCAAPVVAMIHHPLALESGLDPGLAAHLYALERENLRHAAHVLVPSPHTARVLVDRYGVAPGDITVAPPGTDRPSLPARPQTPPLILSVGLQHPRKGHDILIAALQSLSDLDWEAVIVGPAWDPPFADRLAALRQGSGVAPRITLAGLADQATLEALWARASIFALATRYEGYGIVFDEALVRGLPIVTCRVGAVPDTVPKEAGILVPPEDSAAFACALRQVLTDPSCRQALTQASATAGAALLTWADTARTAASVLDALPL